MAEFHQGSCDYLLKTPPDYTFHIEKLGYRSFIDYFVCSSHLITKVDSLHILDSGCNLSDHLAISLCVCRLVTTFYYLTLLSQIRNVTRNQWSRGLDETKLIW